MVVLNGANDNFLIQKKYYDFALEAFLRSEAALKIPVRKKYFFFRKISLSMMPKHISRWILVLSFSFWRYDKKKQCFLQISSLEFTKNSEHFGHLNFSNTFKND